MGARTRRAGKMHSSTCFRQGTHGLLALSHLTLRSRQFVQLKGLRVKACVCPESDSWGDGGSPPGMTEKKTDQPASLDSAALLVLGCRLESCILTIRRKNVCDFMVRKVNIGSQRSGLGKARASSPSPRFSRLHTGHRKWNKADKVNLCRAVRIQAVIAVMKRSLCCCTGNQAGPYTADVAATVANQSLPSYYVSVEKSSTAHISTPVHY